MKTQLELADDLVASVDNAQEPSTQELVACWLTYCMEIAPLEILRLG